MTMESLMVLPVRYSRFSRPRVRTLFLLLLLLLPGSSYAQEATLSGTVTDSTGAVLPGVTVTARHAATGNQYETLTDERGHYRIPLRIGAYEIRAQLQGFTTFT